MSKEDVIKFQGEIMELLPSATFKVRLENTESIVICHTAGKIRQNRIRIALGDRVDVEMSIYDQTKGRITYRHT